MTAQRSDRDTTEDGTIEEPANSTVDDWFGQNVARDQEVVDRALQEESDDAAAEERFDREADGEERHRAGYPRPDDADEPHGDAVGDPS